MSTIAQEIIVYNTALQQPYDVLGIVLMEQIMIWLPHAENKIRHGHPVWFLDGNPIVWYDKMKDCMRLLFWSGQWFDDSKLQSEGKFKAAGIRYTTLAQIDKNDIERRLDQSIRIQWDYKNIVKRKGVLEKLS